MIRNKLSSLWTTVFLVFATFDISSAITLPEDAIPSVTSLPRRQAPSQCSQILSPVSRVCSTPKPDKREDEPTVTPGAPSPGSPVARQAPTPTCSQVYTTHVSCGGGGEYEGTTQTIPPSNTIPGLPGGTTASVHTAALSMNVCPAASNAPWEVQMTPDLKDRIIDIADEVCKKHGAPDRMRIRQGLSGLNHPSCNFHHLGKGAKREFRDRVSAEVRPQIYFPLLDPGSLECLPEGWASKNDYEDLVAVAVGLGIGYLFDKGWDLWEYWNMPAEVGQEALSSESSSSTSSSTISVTNTAWDPPTKSSSSSSKTTRPKGDPGPTRSKSKTTTTTSSSADACPTDITIDPNEDQGQDGPTPTLQIPIQPSKTKGVQTTYTGKKDLPCTLYADPHNKDCNVCECAGKGTTLTVPTKVGTYATPVKGTLITTTNLCFYTDWPNTKSVSTTTCLSPEEIAQSKSIQSALSENSKHLTPPGFTPGSPMQTCQPDPNHSMPICDLKNGGHDNLPKAYCACPKGGTGAKTVPYSTTHTSLTSCDPGLGTVTHLDVCPWTTTPPESMKIDTRYPGTTYAGSTLPPAETARPYCEPAGPSEQGFEENYLRKKIELFCMNAVGSAWSLGPGVMWKEWHLVWKDVGQHKNGHGYSKNKALHVGVTFNEESCPAHWDGKPVKITNRDDCVDTFLTMIVSCSHIEIPVDPYHLRDKVRYWYGGGTYKDCLYWEVVSDDKFAT